MGRACLGRDWKAYLLHVLGSNRLYALGESFFVCFKYLPKIYGTLLKPIV